MAKRTLPQRSTRGQLPSHLKETPPPLKRTRPASQTNPQQTERKELQNKLKSQQISNLMKFPFCRAVHYCFPLEDFPRVPCHISYAVDVDNALGNTFSKDKDPLAEGCYGDVLNRKFFGLPAKNDQNFSIRKQNRCKNVAYSYLYELQNKKYQIDRQICTLRVVLSRLRKGPLSPQFQSMEIIQKDQELSSVLDPEVPLSKKISILEDRIEVLRDRKQFNMQNWLVDDRIYYYHSLNQKLHNAISDLKQNILDERLVSFIFETDPSRYRLKGYTPDLQYFNTQAKVLSSGVKLRKMLPVGVFHFEGGLKAVKYALQIIARKSESLGETTFYQVKNMIRNLFGFDLVLKSEKSQTYTIYQKTFMKRCEEIKKHGARQWSSDGSYPTLDHFASKGELTIASRTEISGRQYILATIFYWLCLGFAELQTTLDNFPDLFSFLASDYFPKVSNYLVVATDSALAGMLCAAMESLSDLFSRPDPFLTLPTRLLFEFNSSVGVALVFREDTELQTSPSGRWAGWEEERGPSKKVKRDI